jgi:hypothetical protein
VRLELPSYFWVERSLDDRRRSRFDVLSRLSGVYLLFLFILSHFINLISPLLSVCKSRSQIAHAASVLVVKAHPESTKQVALMSPVKLRSGKFTNAEENEQTGDTTAKRRMQEPKRRRTVPFL